MSCPTASPRWRSPLILAAGLCLLAGSLPGAAPLTFKTSRGIPLYLFPDPSLNYVHAELTLTVRHSPTDRNALPLFRLATRLLLGDRKSGLLNRLRAVSPEFSVEERPDSLRIAVDFLPGRLAEFTQFVKSFFSSQSFSVERVAAARSRFWSDLTRSGDWKRDLALQVAFHSLFAGSSLGPLPLGPGAAAGLNAAQLRSYWTQVCRPAAGTLMLKGHLNPYVTLGLLEKAMSGSPGKGSPLPVERLPVHNQRRVFFLDVPDHDYPQLFLIDAASVAGTIDMLPIYVATFSLFHYPTGRIYEAGRSQFNILNCPVTSELIQYPGVVVLVSSARVAPGEVDKMMGVMEGERRRLGNSPVGRKEYLDALNFFWKKNSVETTRVDHDLNVAQQNLFSEPTQMMNGTLASLLQKASLERVQHSMEDYFSPATRGRGERGIYVIVGNAQAMPGLIRDLKPEVISLPVGE